MSDEGGCSVRDESVPAPPVKYSEESTFDLKCVSANLHMTFYFENARVFFITNLTDQHRKCIHALTVVAQSQKKNLGVQAMKSPRRCRLTNCVIRVGGREQPQTTTWRSGFAWTGQLVEGGSSNSAKWSNLSRTRPVAPLSERGPGF